MTIETANLLLRQNMLQQANELQQINLLLQPSAPTTPIAYVGTGNSALLVSQLNQPITVTYSSAAGNTLLIHVCLTNDNGTVGQVLSVIDSNGNDWTSITNAETGDGQWTELWGFNSPQVISSVTVTVAGSATNPNNGYYLTALLTEYSGVNGFGATSENDNFQPGQGGLEPNITQDIIGANNWIVAFMAAKTEEQAATANMGILRYQEGYVGSAGHASSSGNTLTVVSGGHFQPPFVGMVSWVGFPIVFNGVTFTVASVPDANHLVLTTSPGTLVNKPWSYTAQGPGESLYAVDNTISVIGPVECSVNAPSVDDWGVLSVELIA